jgi:hypothetical protein
MKFAAISMLAFIGGCSNQAAQQQISTACDHGPRGYTHHAEPFWQLAATPEKAHLLRAQNTTQKLNSCFLASPKPASLLFREAKQDASGSVYMAFDDEGTSDVQYVFVVDPQNKITGAYEVGTLSGPALSSLPKPSVR